MLSFCPHGPSYDGNLGTHTLLHSTSSNLTAGLPSDKYYKHEYLERADLKKKHFSKMILDQFNEAEAKVYHLRNVTQSGKPTFSAVISSSQCSHPRSPA